jgi:hypothetical protein
MERPGHLKTIVSGTIAPETIGFRRIYSLTDINDLEMLLGAPKPRYFWSDYWDCYSRNRGLEKPMQKPTTSKDSGNY